jgi:hypothetical protein
MGRKKPENIRMTYLENFAKSNNKYWDVTIKIPDEQQKAHQISDTSIGRIVLIYGKLVANGTGVCFDDLGWGEFALLPQQYENLLM